jgi:hypothetical protein
LDAERPIEIFGGRFQMKSLMAEAVEPASLELGDLSHELPPAIRVGTVPALPRTYLQ